MSAPSSSEIQDLKRVRTHFAMTQSQTLTLGQIERRKIFVS